MIKENLKKLAVLKLKSLRNFRIKLEKLKILVILVG